MKGTLPETLRHLADLIEAGPVSLPSYLLRALWDSLLAAIKIIEG